MGASGWRRAKASRRWVSVAARSPAWIANRTWRSRSSLAGQLVVQYVQVAQDGLQQVVEVMGDAAGKLADGLHLLGLPQGFLRLLALRHFRPDAFLQSGVQQSKLILRRFLAVDIDGGAEPAGDFAGRLRRPVRSSLWSWSGLARATNQR